MADQRIILDRNEPSKAGDNASRYVHGVVFDKAGAKSDIDGLFSSLGTLDSEAARKLRDITDTSELAALPLNLELTLPLAVAVPPDPTPLQRYLAAYQLLLSALRKVEAGAGPKIDSAEVLELRAAAQALYRPEFVGIS